MMRRGARHSHVVDQAAQLQQQHSSMQQRKEGLHDVQQHHAVSAVSAGNGHVLLTMVSNSQQ
jgi:hypothetical protein